MWSNYAAAFGRMGVRPFRNSALFTASIVLGQRFFVEGIAMTGLKG